MTVSARASGRKKYGAILADPPWSWKARSPKGEGRSAKQHYDVMDLDAVKAMNVGPTDAADNCALFMWFIDSMMPEALEVVTAWGFTYKTIAFDWVKTSKDGTKFPIGMGYWTRANPEKCLLATRGHPKRLSAAVRQLQFAPRLAHSQKPLIFRDKIRELVDGPYLELFARHGRTKHWNVRGNERGKLSLK